jgi:hypothetical protein
MRHVISEQRRLHPMTRKSWYDNRQMAAAMDDGKAEAEDCGD